MERTQEASRRQVHVWRNVVRGKLYTVQDTQSDGKCFYRCIANQLVYDAYGINLGGLGAKYKLTYHGQVQTAGKPLSQAYSGRD